MQVEIIEDMHDLESLRGIVVVFDIFRASNTILSLLAAGANKIVLMSELQAAYSLKRQNPSWLLFGEREGLPPQGFDGGNSPVAASRLSLDGQTVVFTTSAGTQAVHHLSRADTVFFASFANAKAVNNLITGLKPGKVHLLPMGFKAKEPAEEDSLGAFYLKGSLLGSPPYFPSIKERLLSCKCAELLRRLKQDIDLGFCTSLDTHDLVPVVRFEKYPVAIPWALEYRSG